MTKGNVKNLNEWSENYTRTYRDDEKTCPNCGFLMQFVTEKYGTSGPYEDKWWECPVCGTCIDANFTLL